MTLRLIIIGLMFFVKCSQEVYAQESFQLSTMSGAMFSHSSVTDNLNFRKSLGIQSTVLWKLPPSNSSVPAKPALNYRYLGFSVYGLDLGDGFLNGKKIVREQLTGMGLGAGAMMITGANIHLNSSSNKTDFKLQCGFGPMMVTKYYNPISNPSNLAISSALNFGSQMRGQLHHQVNASSTVSAGLEMFHISNSNFQKPNNGLNYIQANIGWMYLLHDRGKHPASNRPLSNDKCYYVGKSSEQFSSPFQVSFRMAYRKYRSEIPVNYPVWILEADYGFSNKKMKINQNNNHSSSLPKGEWRIGLDLFHENAATTKTASGSLLSIDPRWELGLYGRRVFRVGFVDVFVDLGTYLIPPQPDRIKLLQKSKWLYNSFGTQYRISKNVFLIYRMKAHYHIADYLEMGLVARL